MAQGQLDAFEAFLKTRTEVEEGHHEVTIQLVPALGSDVAQQWTVTHYDTAGIFAKLKGRMDTRFFPWSSILQIY